MYNKVVQVYLYQTGNLSPKQIHSKALCAMLYILIFKALTYNV